MLILAADTSGKNGSLALLRFRSGEERVVDLVPLEGGTFSAQLIPQIAAILEKHKLEKSKLGGFAVVSGPGSFTGLRVGLAAIKALADVLNKPIAAVSLLEAVARASEFKRRQGSRVVAALDAGRGEIYVSEFEFVGGRFKCNGQILQSMSEFISSAEVREIVTPDPNLAEAFRGAGLSITLVAPPKADAIARLGFEKIQAGETVTPEALDAAYIRRSDAEMKKSSQ
jgi:tRNA threonylcarbamoyladenosine biosynthesis protein TsaB